MSFKPGDFIQYNHRNGSVGVVTHVRPMPVGPDRLYVTYAYGLDVKGKQMTSAAGVCSRDVVSIPEHQYDLTAWTPGFGAGAADQIVKPTQETRP